MYLGILVKRVAPEHEVVIYERNRAAETFGFGVVFSDATLGHLKAADPETSAQITARFERWDDIEIHFKGEVLRSTGHGFCGLERKALLQILQTRAAGLGVRVEYEHDLEALDSIDADLIVASDGVASWVRDALAPALQPLVDVRSNKFVWLGCTVPYRAFTFLFRDTPHGMFRVHAYPFQAGASTFIVECREETWRAAGLADADEDRTLEIIGDIFREHLGEHRLIKNRSIWRSFPTVRCATWSAPSDTTGSTPVVLLGDAAHTAHFSIGSGTKLAMEDAIVLRDELLREGHDLPSALAAYEAKRRPEVEALQAAAQASLEWFEGTERYAQMAPVQFTYSLMTRSLRVSHASVAKRDPHLARGVEQLLAAKVGVTCEPPLPPTALPYVFGAHKTRAPNRIAIACKPTHTGELANDDDLVAMGSVAAIAGLVVTPAISIDTAMPGDAAASPGAASATTPISGPRINTDEQAVAWRRVVEFVHAKGALVVARIATSGAVPRALEAAVQRAAFAGFDLLLLDPGAAPNDVAVEHLPGMVQAARAIWPETRAIAAWIHDRPATRASMVVHAAQLVRAGASQLWVSSSGDAQMAGARLPAAPLADRLRNELHVATAVVADSIASLPDLDAAIAAGRADLVVTSQLPGGFARRT